MCGQEFKRDPRGGHKIKKEYCHKRSCQHVKKQARLQWQREYQKTYQPEYRKNKKKPKGKPKKIEYTGHYCKWEHNDGRECGRAIEVEEKHGAKIINQRLCRRHRWMERLKSRSLNIQGNYLYSYDRMVLAEREKKNVEFI